MISVFSLKADCTLVGPFAGAYEKGWTVEYKTRQYGLALARPALSCATAIDGARLPVGNRGVPWRSMVCGFRACRSSAAGPHHGISSERVGTLPGRPLHPDGGGTGRLPERRDGGKTAGRASSTGPPDRRRPERRTDTGLVRGNRLSRAGCLSKGLWPFAKWASRS